MMGRVTAARGADRGPQEYAEDEGDKRTVLGMLGVDSRERAQGWGQVRELRPLQVPSRGFPGNVHVVTTRLTLLNEPNATFKGKVSAPRSLLGA
jgi:CRISPR/Cas system CMR subunit Cmr4 (Cas7 group RAMP superfamily)